MYTALIPSIFHFPVQAGSRIQIFNMTKPYFLSLVTQSVAQEQQPGEKARWYLHQHSPPCTLPLPTASLLQKGESWVSLSFVSCLPNKKIINHSWFPGLPYCPSSTNKGKKANSARPQGTWKHPAIPKIEQLGDSQLEQDRPPALPGSAASSGSGGAFLTKIP